ncbi:MAG: translation initiation factor IF-3 [Myxococcota bacterium]
MARRFRGRPRPDRPQYRVNHRIRFREIRVVDPDGTDLGVMSPDEGRALASSHRLDLVEVAPQARPPVCRIMDFGKFKYEQSKKKSQAKQATLKTVQMRPKTGEHDLDTKLNRARKFLLRGDKVKLVMRMRGREKGVAERWRKMLRERYEARLGDIARVVTAPSRAGHMISMLVAPDPAAA